MNDSTNICLACGLCCDGTLIGFVEVAQEELPRLKGIKEVENVDGHGFFLQPCDRFCDECTIYADRPKQCDLFKCDLLNAVDQKELAFEQAVAITQEVKQQKISIEKKVASLQLELKSPSFYFKMVELKKVLQKENGTASFTNTHLKLIEELKQLDTLLSKRFGVTLD